MICFQDWGGISLQLANLATEDDARKFKSVVDRLRNMLGEVNDTYSDVI